MYWMLLPFRRYADFSGRSRRMEYWMFYLFNVILTVLLFLLTLAVQEMGPDMSGAVIGIWVVYGLAIIIPGLAVAVRRLHDSDKSGWMLLISLIPFGGLVLLYFYCIEGDHGPNRYGPDPLDENPDPEVFA